MLEAQFCSASAMPKCEQQFSQALDRYIDRPCEIRTRVVNEASWRKSSTVTTSVLPIPLFSHPFFTCYCRMQLYVTYCLSRNTRPNFWCCWIREVWKIRTGTFAVPTGNKELLNGDVYPCARELVKIVHSYKREIGRMKQGDTKEEQWR